jgi:hypothetical protein
MPRISPTLLVLLLLPSVAYPAAPPRRDEGPRALIRRALRAAGLQDGHRRRVAMRRRCKMEMTVGGSGPTFTATGFIIEQTGRAAVRVELEMKFGSNNKMVLVRKGKKGWRSIGGNVGDLSAADLKENERQVYLDRVTDLVDLLTDKHFTLTPLGPSKVDGRPALGVKVSLKGKPDVSLHFDRATGLLVKYATCLTGASKGMQEVILRDYSTTGQAEARALRAARVKTTGVGLLAYLKKQIPASDRAARAAKLVKDLGDDDFDVREAAEKALVALGTAALPALRAAVKSPDLEVRMRALRCIKDIGPERARTTTGAAVRLLAQRRPAGAVALLLDLLPGADEALAGDIYSVLATLAQPGGKPHPLLVKALAGKDPVRRAAATAVLGKDGGAYLKKPGRRIFLPRREARTQVFILDGKPTATVRFEPTEFFNRFDDKLFARP